MGRSVTTAAARKYRERSNARNAALKEELLAKLIIAALDVLHHDRTTGSEVDKYERSELRREFVKVLYPKRRARSAAPQEQTDAQD